MSVENIAASSSTPKVVRFKLNYNLKYLLLSFANKNDSNSYEELLCHIRDLGQEIRDDDLMQLLKEARGCVSILDTNFKLFVHLVLILRWAHRSNEVVQEYQGFLHDLCSAHNYYTKVVLNHLVSYFKTDTGGWSGPIPGETSKKCYQNLHEVIKSILFCIPMSRDLFLSCIKSNYPYLRKPSKEHLCYVYNLLLIVQYEPSLKHELLKMIVDQLIKLDVHCPQKELESLNETQMEVDDDTIFTMDDTTKEPKHHIANSLDGCLYLVYKYIWSETHSADGQLLWDKTKSLYQEIMKLFDEMILPTHATNHAQFIVFYFLGLKPSLGQLFVQQLWKKVLSVNVAPIIRQAAVCYMASFIARATFLPLIIVKDTIYEMSSWLHSYIDNEDSSSGNSQDIRIHGVFYTTCQSLFYIIAFLHKDLVQNKGLSELQNLGLSKIVTCRLNPLRVCLPVVVSNFASVARSYQLAYCYSIIERNSRCTLPTVYRDSTGALSGVTQIHLDSFFPFDPYLLIKSKEFIVPLFREYAGLIEKEKSNVCSSSSKDEDEDDFLDAATPTESHSALNAFSYSTSPGFLHA